MKTWIFQANPAIYDVRTAVRSLREDTWLVHQYSHEIRPGDRVFVWESGSSGGIVGIAEVLDEVLDRELPDESRPFVRDESKLGGIKPRVLIRILKIIDPRLKRSVIKAHAGLGELLILKQPQGTNFPVTPEQAKIIEQLLAG